MPAKHFCQGDRGGGGIAGRAREDSGGGLRDDNGYRERRSLSDSILDTVRVRSDFPDGCPSAGERAGWKGAVSVTVVGFTVVWETRRQSRIGDIGVVDRAYWIAIKHLKPKLARELAEPIL